MTSGLVRNESVVWWWVATLGLCDLCVFLQRCSVKVVCSVNLAENAVAATTKPKRRAYLLKRKALTTGFFDQSRAKDADKDKESSTGSVFGVPLSQCVETERALRRQQHGGSRASLASLGTLEKGDDSAQLIMSHCWAHASTHNERAGTVVPTRAQCRLGTAHIPLNCFAEAKAAALPIARLRAAGLCEALYPSCKSESCDSGEWGWSGLEEAGGGGPKVPALVSACLAHLRRHGLRTLGLFRVSASKKRVRQLREEWERGQEAALDAAVCPHDVATLLKEFLRDLPDPLLCRDLYPAFLCTQKIRNRRLQWEALRMIVQLLPTAHRDTLNALLSFLSQLAAHAEDDRQPGNKMDAANIATIFAPNILHKNKPNEAASAEQLSERADVINVVRQLIERQGELWTLPAELLHEAYIHLAHMAPAHLDSLLLRRSECAAEAKESLADSAARRVWSREQFLHGAAATGGPNMSTPSEKTYSRSRRTRENASDTSSGSISSAMTIMTRVRSSVEECGSSGVVCTPASATRTDSAPDSNDSASDYNEVSGYNEVSNYNEVSDYNATLGGSDDDSYVITASLHIPAAFPSPAPARPAAPPRRRSTSGSESSAKRDSAVGSSPASASSASPPASPPPPAPAPAPLRVTLTAGGELRRPTDIDRLISLGRERNTSDARAVVLRQHDETTVTRTRARAETRKEDTRREETRQETRPERKEGTLYKRGELISSARSPPT
ncbi:hypothetical protein MSG28_009403 [Choristoneura fumiferana]|uniref:Uncharacterized protein n=1 Tax=Choristoneura fumiferana TaxID=7141 RepID=A0ACC0KXY3_CHOFU|nr:hypothetical protein MSG28_009403 [Choristoneura fumiferana]